MAAIQAIYAGHVLRGCGTFEEIPPDLAEMSRRRADVLARDLPYMVAEIDGVVTGFAYAAPYRMRSGYRYLLEDSVYVAEDATGKGVGRALLEELIGRCTARGYRQMIAVIGDSANQASIAVHANLGFDQVGLFPSVGFKFGRWVDSVIMQRSLGEGNGTLPAR